MKVAKSYSGYKFDETKAFEQHGKLYVRAVAKCSRCTNGVYVARVENDHIVPHPNCGGVCFECGGTGVIEKVVRLYTDKEYEAMERANEKAREKKAAEMEARMQREFADTKKKWLEENGFSEDGLTYVYWKEDSYARKEELKALGYKFNPQLKWHINTNTGNEEDTICVKADDVVEFSAWGKGNYFANAKADVEKMINAKRPHKDSDWYGEAGAKIEGVSAKYINHRTMETRFGYSTVYTFVKDSYTFTWFTSKILTLEVGDEVTLSGTIKELKEYNGIKQTVLTRCKVE